MPSGGNRLGGKGKLKYEPEDLNLTIRNLSKISFRNNEVNYRYNY